jgi:hypothetical protein
VVVGGRHVTTRQRVSYLQPRLFCISTIAPAPESRAISFLDVRSTSPPLAPGSLMTTQGNNETAINGRIDTAQQAVRLAEAADSCRAMGLPNPGSPQTHCSLQSKRHAAPGPGFGTIMDWTKTGSPQTMVSPKSILPPQPVSDKPWLRRMPDPGEGGQQNGYGRARHWLG